MVLQSVQAVVVIFSCHKMLPYHKRRAPGLMQADVKCDSLHIQKKNMKTMGQPLPYQHTDLKLEVNRQ